MSLPQARTVPSSPTTRKVGRRYRGHLFPVEVPGGNLRPGHGAHGPGEHAEQRALRRAGLGHKLPGVLGYRQEVPSEIFAQRAQEGHHEFLTQARDLPFQPFLGQAVQLRQGDVGPDAVVVGTAAPSCSAAVRRGRPPPAKRRGRRWRRRRPRPDRLRSSGSASKSAGCAVAVAAATRRRTPGPKPARGGPGRRKNRTTPRHRLSGRAGGPGPGPPASRPGPPGSARRSSGHRPSRPRPGHCGRRPGATLRGRDGLSSTRLPTTTARPYRVARAKTKASPRPGSHSGSL